MKKAMVTGASSGIGREFVRQLAADGYAVTCVARRRKRLAKLVQELGTVHRFIAADLTKKTALTRIARDIQKTHYDLLVNNAGFGIYSPFDKCPSGEFEAMIELNIVAVMRLCHVYVTHAKPGDAVINVASVLGLLAYPGGAVYSGSKGFVVNFSEALWYEQKKRGVFVMALCPGLTATEFSEVASRRLKSVVHMSRRYAYPPQTVVREALCALARRKQPTLISGPRFRWIFFFLTRLIGRKYSAVLLGKNSPWMTAFP